VLVDEALLPVSPRLPAVLALADEQACGSLLAALADQFGPGSPVWAAAVVEAFIAAHDADVPPPPTVARAWDELLAGDPHGAAEAERSTGRLRLQARRDPAAALPLLDEAIGAVGTDRAETAIEAVLGRLGAVDESAAAAFVAADVWRPDERALLFRASVWAAPPPEAPARLAALARAVGTAELPPLQLWAASHELLAACARVGDAALAVDLVRTLGPPGWTVWNATWAPARKRGADPAAYVAALAAALAAPAGAAAQDTAPAPSWGLLPTSWQRDYAWLKALPLGALPWWRPWGGGLP
jgi:hypothetical protein